MELHLVLPHPATPHSFLGFLRLFHVTQPALTSAALRLPCLRSPVLTPLSLCHRLESQKIRFLYDIIHVLMPFSQIIPPPPPPPVQVQCRIQEAWGWCTGMTRGMVRGGRWEGGSGWGTRVHPWQMHVDVWQNQYNIVK